MAWDLPLTDRRCLAALSTWVDAARIQQAVATFGSWQRLRAAAIPQRVAVLGHHDPARTLPETPPIPDGGEGLGLVGCFDDSYPPVLRAQQAPPPVLWARWRLPTPPTVWVAGPPGHTAPQQSARAARAAVAAGAEVLARADTPIGQVALSEAFRAGGRAVAVSEAGLRAAGDHIVASLRAAVAGGAALSAAPPQARASQDTGVAVRISAAYAAALLWCAPPSWSPDAGDPPPGVPVVSVDAHGTVDGLAAELTPHLAGAAPSAAGPA